MSFPTPSWALWTEVRKCDNQADDGQGGSGVHELDRVQYGRRRGRSLGLRDLTAARVRLVHALLCSLGLATGQCGPWLLM